MSHESKFNNHMQNELWVRALAGCTGKPGGTGEAEAVMGWGELPLRVPTQAAAEPTGQCSQLHAESYTHRARGDQKWLCRQGALGPWAWGRTLSLPSQSPKEVPKSCGLGDQATCLCRGYDPGLRSLSPARGGRLLLCH